MVGSGGVRMEKDGRKMEERKRKEKANGKRKGKGKEKKRIFFLEPLC
mgnify:CR=1 FL=1